MTTAQPTSIRTAILEEAAQALTGRHCSPESVTDTPDGGIIRRCRPCNGEGLVR